LPFTLSFPFLEPQPVVAVHAGLVPGVPLEQQLRKHMTTMRNLQLMAAPAATEGGWRGGGGGGEGGGGGAGRPRLVALERSDQGEAWAKLWEGPAHVMFGHDARRGIQQEPFATGLDTGCCYGHKLSAQILPSGEIVQVDAKEQYKAIAPSPPLPLAGS